MSNELFTEDIRQGIDKLGAFNGETDKQDLSKLYDEVSGDYEKLMCTMGHPDPEQCGDMALELLKDLSDKSALDLGCGTGMVGAALKKRGIHELLGIDASEGMLKQAAAKNCYD